MFRVVPFLVILSLCLSSPAWAEEATAADTEPTATSDEAAAANESEPYDFRMTDWSVDTQLRPNQGWRFGGQALMAPVYFFGHILMHEGSHALMGMACGFEVDRFYPYPVTVPIQQTAEDEPQDTFFWGLTIFEPRPVSEVEDWQVALTTIAPFMMDTLLFLTGDLILEYAANPHSVGAPFLLAGLMMAPLGDFIVGLLSTHDGSDLHQFSEASGVPYGITAGIGWAMVIVGLWRVAHQFRRVFMEPTPEALERERGIAVSVLPIAHEDMQGIGVVGRF